ncbi:restriction endonuclease [Winogradskyella epiphytica]|uniref:Restriction endonuclease n=1 Tax=Winogradskyella epiphytica TaxID=262005 RepID=A0A2V4WT58_9FLAO|nr:restriction endonuclease [Winogradskyella epiphytica]PYE79262.1 restriction endonuclease [Winogradskyella epiphytica]GGW74498.1 hypothetical protein GCM10008085_28260 [Winogradskyella epiphytica]
MNSDDNKDISDWYHFQEEICTHFNSLGARAETNVTVNGTRTKHDIDILVKTKFLGQDILWIIEAKKWNHKVNKLHVLALRTIVNDIGADKGFIISDKGFQSGAIEAAKDSNITLNTFNDLIEETKHFIQGEILKSYNKRFDLLETRYWAHSKPIRKKYGLRGEIWDYPVDFSGQFLLKTAHWAIEAAEKNEYPINLETFMVEKQGELIANNFQELINWLNLNLNYMDEKILKAEILMMKNGEFHPELFDRKDSELPIKFLTKYDKIKNKKK